jgi:hypothetical protein
MGLSVSGSENIQKNVAISNLRGGQKDTRKLIHWGLCPSHQNLLFSQYIFTLKEKTFIYLFIYFLCANLLFIRALSLAQIAWP